MRIAERIRIPDSEIRNRVVQTALATLKHQRAPANSSLVVVLSDDAHLQTLNQQFMGVDAPTDVLAFPNDAELPAEDDKPEGPYLGDVIISVQRAEAQAHADGHTPLAELQLLTVHGVLHLLGYDHAQADEKERMWAAQVEILQRLGAGITGEDLKRNEN